MSPDRRNFLRTATLAGGALAVPGGWPGIIGSSTDGAPGRSGRPIPPADRSMRILILGGTGFIGPHEVAYAVARGHRVTVFNRGRSQADLPDGIEELRGDRNTGDLDALRGREWDAVIDNPTTLPFWIRDAAEILAGSTGQYLMVSTISVYDPRGVDRIDEDTPRVEYTDGDPLEVRPDQSTGALYGPMKAASEDETLRHYGERATIVRPGLIVGPGDPTDRFTWWPVRIARGGDVLAPGDGTDPVQIIDARDLAEWIVRVVEEGHVGVYNATGPRAPLSMAEQLYGIRAALPGDLDVRFRWAPVEVLQEHGVRPWSEMTTWFGPDAALSRASIERAVGAGLSFRPLATTAADTLGWWRSLPADRRESPLAGIDPDKEARVLASLQ